MPGFTYTGDQPVIFSHYLDVTDPENVATLVAEPGQTYDIRQAEGHHVLGVDGEFTEQALPMPPDGDWTQVKPKPEPKKKPEET